MRNSMYRPKQGWRACTCVCCLCVHVRLCACMRLCGRVRACAGVCVRECVCLRRIHSLFYWSVRVRACVRACVRVRACTKCDCAKSCDRTHLLLIVIMICQASNSVPETVITFHPLGYKVSVQGHNFIVGILHVSQNDCSRLSFDFFVL